MIEFLESINKSRLAILENGSIKYIIHRSTFLDALNKETESGEIKFEKFTKDYKSIIETFLIIEQDEILENVRK